MTWFRCQASRWGSGMDAITRFPRQTKLSPTRYVHMYVHEVVDADARALGTLDSKHVPRIVQHKRRPAARTRKKKRGTALETRIPSTLLISPAPKPVNVRLCLGREMPAGPTPPVMSTMGAPVEGRLSLVGSRCCSVAMVSSFLRKQQVNQPSISSHAKAGLSRGDLGSRALAPQGIYLAS